MWIFKVKKIDENHYYFVGFGSYSAKVYMIPIPKYLCVKEICESIEHDMQSYFPYIVLTNIRATSYGEDQGENRIVLLILHIAMMLRVC